MYFEAEAETVHKTQLFVVDSLSLAHLCRFRFRILLPFRAGI